MSAITDQQELTAKFKELIAQVKSAMPQGQIPEKEAIADLKGIGAGIEPGFIQDVMRADNVPPYLLKAFDPESDLFQEAIFPSIELMKTEIEKIDITVEEVEFNEEELKEKGFTEEQIQEAKRLHELKLEYNKISSEIQNEVKEKTKELVEKTKGIEASTNVEDLEKDQKLNLALQDWLDLGKISTPEHPLQTEKALAEIAAKWVLKTSELRQHIVDKEAQPLEEWLDSDTPDFNSPDYPWVMGGEQFMGDNQSMFDNTNVLPNISLNESPIEQKRKAFDHFKAQINEVNQRIELPKEKICELVDLCKEILEDASKIEDQTQKIEVELGELESFADQLESQTNQMKPTFPAHPGPGNKANSSVTQKARNAKDIAEGFKANSEQAEKNTGTTIEEGVELVKKILKLLMELKMSFQSLLLWLLMVKQMLELSFLLNLKNSNQTANTDSIAQSPEEFLTEIGYPGYGVEDFSTILQNEINGITPQVYQTSTDIYPTEDLTEPIYIGDYQFGEPLTFPLSEGYNFTDHPILGDISNIHPQLINELYNEGVIPLANEPGLDPSKYEEDLDKLYDNILSEIIDAKQIEYIEKLYNVKFEMIGYKRYMAKA